MCPCKLYFNFVFLLVKCDPNKDTLFECEKIIEKLKKIDPSKTMGPDKVSGTVLKNCAESLSLAFSIIFKKSYESGEVSELWKHANVTPIHKGGSKLSKKNYRPVSLTCLVCKIFESLLKDIMLQHLLRKRHKRIRKSAEKSNKINS